MTLRDDLLPVLDSIRGIPSALGLYQFTVIVRVRTWTVSSGPGRGTYTDVDTPITVGGSGRYNPKISHVTTKDIVASGGLYTDQDLKLGPLTPQYLGGGISPDTLDPPVGTTAREIFFNVKGPGQPMSSGWYKRIGDDSESAMHYYVTLRHIGTIP